jgi:6-pyruvoyl-tetrahydropterin synthase
LDVYVRGELDRKAGWIMDFADIDDRIVPLVKRLDHTLINDTINNPTAENIVLWLLHEIETLGFTWTYTRPGVWKLALRETERGAVSYEWPWVGFDDKYAQSLAILPETTR